MEVNELAKLLIFIGLLVIIILIMSGSSDKLMDLTDKLKTLLVFR